MVATNSITDPRSRASHPLDQLEMLQKAYISITEEITQAGGCETHLLAEARRNRAAQRFLLEEILKSCWIVSFEKV